MLKKENTVNISKETLDAKKYIINRINKLEDENNRLRLEAQTLSWDANGSNRSRVSDLAI